MKTTVEIDDDLLKAAKRVAAEEGTSLRTLVQEGLWNRIALSEHSQRLGEIAAPDSGITRADLYEARVWKVLEGLERARERAASEAAR